MRFVEVAFIVTLRGCVGSSLESGTGRTGFGWILAAACRVDELEMPRVLDALRIRPFCAHTAKMRPVWREIIQGLLKLLRLRELGGRSAIQSFLVCLKPCLRFDPYYGCLTFPASGESARVPTVIRRQATVLNRV